MSTGVVSQMEMHMFSDVWSGYSAQHSLLYHSNSYQNMPLSNGEVHFMVLCWSFWCQPILRLPSTTPSCCHTHVCLISSLCLSMLRLPLPACDPSGMIKHWQKNDSGRFVTGRIRRPVFQICFFFLALYEAHRTWIGRWFPPFSAWKIMWASCQNQWAGGPFSLWSPTSEGYYEVSQHHYKVLGKSHIKDTASWTHWPLQSTERLPRALDLTLRKH